MADWKRGKFTIKGPKGSSEVSGVVSGSVGIYKSGANAYTVTHIPSGGSMGRDHRFESDAKSVAERIIMMVSGLGVDLRLADPLKGVSDANRRVLYELGQEAK